MRSLRRSSRRRAHPRWAAWPHAARMHLYMPFASTARVEGNWMWSAARAGAVTSAIASASEDILAKAPMTGKNTLEPYGGAGLAVELLGALEVLAFPAPVFD